MELATEVADSTQWPRTTSPESLAMDAATGADASECANCSGHATLSHAMDLARTWSQIGMSGEDLERVRVALELVQRELASAATSEARGFALRRTKHALVGIQRRLTRELEAAAARQHKVQQRRAMYERLRRTAVLATARPSAPDAGASAASDAAPSSPAATPRCHATPCRRSTPTTYGNEGSASTRGIRGIRRTSPRAGVSEPSRPRRAWDAISPGRASDGKLAAGLPVREPPLDSAPWRMPIPTFLGATLVGPLKVGSPPKALTSRSYRPASASPATARRSSTIAATMTDATAPPGRISQPCSASHGSPSPSPSPSTEQSPPSRAKREAAITAAAAKGITTPCVHVSLRTPPTSACRVVWR